MQGYYLDTNIIKEQNSDMNRHMVNINMPRSGEKFDKCHNFLKETLLQTKKITFKCSVESRFFLKIMSRMLKKIKNVPKFRENKKKCIFPALFSSHIQITAMVFT